MGYIEKTLVPSERVLQQGRLHWIIYARGVWLAVMGLGLAVDATRVGDAVYAEYMGVGEVVFILLAVLSWLSAWIRSRTTEIAATTRRSVVKRGLIRRSVMEIGVGQIESVRIDQSIFGRLFGYGTLIVAGTGAGIDPVRPVAEPLAL